MIRDNTVFILDGHTFLFSMDFSVTTMERWHAKVICIFLIFILPFICTLLPYKVHEHFVRKGNRGKKILSCLMCFGGGVFFATFILHMGPEVRFILEEALIKPYGITYPIADFIMGIGFFVVFFLEKVILKCHKRRQKKKNLKRQEQCYQFNKTTSDGVNKGQVSEHAEENGIWPCDHTNITQVVNGIISETPPHNRDDCPLRGTGECCTDSDEIKIQMTDIDSAAIAGLPMAEDEDIMHSHATRSLILVVALSLHRIFEGMSLGLQHTTQNVWHLFIAVICHETVIGFGLGLQFVKNGFTLKKMLIATALCSMIMPIGVVIGTILVEVGGQSNGLNMVNGILQGISTGTFIYVTFFEILQEEIDPHDTSLSKFFSVLIGFGLMAALTAVPEQNAMVTHPPVDPCNVTSTMVTTLMPDMNI